MTYAPATLIELRDFWVSQGGDDLGIVGDAKHAARSSYHNGKDRIVANDNWDTDYTVRLPRDRCCATNAASAIDLGRLDGTLRELQTFSRWLVRQCQDKAPGTEDIREVIWSPDGKVVRRWDHNTGKIYVGGDGTGQGDDSHLWHTHISYYRDSEKRDKVAVFRRYFEENGTMPSRMRLYPSDRTVLVAEDARLYPDGYPSPERTDYVNIKPARRMDLNAYLPNGPAVVRYMPTGPLPEDWPIRAGWAGYVDRNSVSDEQMKPVSSPTPSTPEPIDVEAERKAAAKEAANSVATAANTEAAKYE